MSWLNKLLNVTPWYYDKIIEICDAAIVEQNWLFEFSTQRFKEADFTPKKKRLSPKAREKIIAWQMRPTQKFIQYHGYIKESEDKEFWDMLVSTFVKSNIKTTSNSCFSVDQIAACDISFEYIPLVCKYEHLEYIYALLSLRFSDNYVRNYEDGKGLNLIAKDLSTYMLGKTPPEAVIMLMDYILMADLALMAKVALLFNDQETCKPYIMLLGREKFDHIKNNFKV